MAWLIPSSSKQIYVRRRTGFLPRRRSRDKSSWKGAKKEGQVTFYTSNTWVAGPVSKEFEKKYPFVKANVWRSDSKELMKRLTEEVTAARFLADVVETSPEYITILMSNKMLQEYLSPELSAYDDDAKIKGKKGVYAWTNREIYISLGFNTKLIPPAEAPKNGQGLSRPQMERKDVHCRNKHRNPVGWSRHGSYGSRVFRKTQRPGY